MKVLVVGSGGREHALAWKIAQSPQVKKLYCAPGNSGTMDIAENVSLSVTDLKGLADFAQQEKIDLTVVGPELPLTMGIVDEFEKKGLKIFGPDQNAAQLEGGKIFAKQFMERHKIPTAKFKVVESPDQAVKIFNSGEFGFPLVVKADGLAAGKGVLICKNLKMAEDAVRLIMVDKQFGDSGDKVVVEEFLRGKEASFIVISDGVKVLPLVTTMDHKPVYDGDIGPNTGGMGAISPSPFIDQELFKGLIIPGYGELGEFLGNAFRGLEEDAPIGLQKHGGIVVGIPGGDGLVIQAPEGLDGLFFGVLDADVVADDFIVFHGQVVTEDGGHLQLTHQGGGEFLEGIRKDHHLGFASQPIQELHSALHGTQGTDHLLDVGEAQIVFRHHLQAMGHQFVVILNVAGGQLQCLDAGLLGDVDPHFGDQDPLQIQTGNDHDRFKKR